LLSQSLLYPLQSNILEDEVQTAARKFVGSYIRSPEFAPKLRAAYVGVFATGRPVFITGEYVSGSGGAHIMS
jgi:hypothetical protein